MFYIRNIIFYFLIYKITFFFLNCHWLKSLRRYCGLHVVQEFKLIAQSIFHTLSSVLPPCVFFFVDSKGCFTHSKANCVFDKEECGLDRVRGDTSIWVDKSHFPVGKLMIYNYFVPEAQYQSHGHALELVWSIPKSF